MRTTSDCRTDVDAFQRLLLELTEERCVERVPRTIVERLVEQPDLALARIWLRQPGDICDECPVRAECPDQTECLHLVASAGRSREPDGPEWTSLDGRFRRFPLGVRKVGRIAAMREAIEVRDVRGDMQWIAEPDWVNQEGILAFAGQPLVFQGEAVGVLAVFTRACLGDDMLVWLRMVADHAAAAIANARAFEEIQSLRDQLELERDYLREEVEEARAFGEIIGQSAAIAKVIDQIDLVAPTDATVLVVGESGTGKELVAREIHARSDRRDRPLVRVNCAAIPRELFEAEFFGFRKGSFTGAVEERVGRFELADGGTLFLDEVGEIPIELQSKLLRVLQDGTFNRLGEPQMRQVDVRIVAATNVDFEKMIDAGRFRQDLYYRLNVFPIEVAPLRKRLEDVPLLAAKFAESSAKRMRVPAPKLTKGDATLLQRYDWPGNVRELQNVVERAVIASRGGRLRFDLPERPIGLEAISRDASNASNASTRGASGDGASDFLTEDEMQRFERDNLIAALTATDWKVYGPGGAADLLGVKPSTLASRMKKFQIERPR